MDELHALRQELADLRREVTTLKRTRWITPGSIVISLLAVVAISVGAPRAQLTPNPTQHPVTQLGQDLVCKSIKIVDADNHDMVHIGSDQDGGYFVVDGADAKPRCYVGVANNAGLCDWFDGAGVRRASVFIGDKGAEFHLADKMEHIGAILQQGDNGGSFALNGVDGNNRLHAGIDNGGGFFDIADALGNLRETFYLSDKNTAQFKIIGADKVTRFLASGEPAGGQLTSYGEDGKAKGQFPAAK